MQTNFLIFSPPFARNYKYFSQILETVSLTTFSALIKNYNDSLFFQPLKHEMRNFIRILLVFFFFITLECFQTHGLAVSGFINLREVVF